MIYHLRISLLWQVESNQISNLKLLFCTISISISFSSLMWSSQILTCLSLNRSEIFNPCMYRFLHPHRKLYKISGPCVFFPNKISKGKNHVLRFFEELNSNSILGKTTCHLPKDLTCGRSIIPKVSFTISVCQSVTTTTKFESNIHHFPPILSKKTLYHLMEPCVKNPMMRSPCWEKCLYILVFMKDSAVMKHQLPDLH